MSSKIVHSLVDIIESVVKLWSAHASVTGFCGTRKENQKKKKKKKEIKRKKKEKKKEEAKTNEKAQRKIDFLRVVGSLAPRNFTAV